MTGVRVRSVVAGSFHSLALGWDGRVYSWGQNKEGQLGHGDMLDRPSPVLVEGIEGVRDIAAACDHSHAVTRSEAVFSWGRALEPEADNQLLPHSHVMRRGGAVFSWVRAIVPETENQHWPVLVEGFGGVPVRRVCAGIEAAFAIGEDGEVFSWGCFDSWNFGRGLILGHGDTRDQPSPTRVEALRDVWVSSVAVGRYHALALAEDGLVYAWGANRDRAVLGNPHVERELLPKTVEALRGVRIGCIAATDHRSYAVADTGEVSAWGCDGVGYAPLGHGEHRHCCLPKPIETLQGVKVDAVAAGCHHTLAQADDGRVYAWGRGADTGALGVLPIRGYLRVPVYLPQRISCMR
jgi:alpha-tubulin suppressor-like RCC1 family protein